MFAVIFLSYEFGPWEEYAVTEDFTIFGSSGTDDYVIVTDTLEHARAQVHSVISQIREQMADA